MSNLKQQMFQQFATEVLRTLIEEYKRKYEPKKEDRFNYRGITYEIGPARVVDNAVEYEISSKIPQDELFEKAGITKYFQGVKRLVTKAKKRPYSVDMENIVREMGGHEVKERDYVKLRYRYEETELYDEGEILKEAKAMAEGRSAEIPPVPGITTLAGRLILLRMRENLREETKGNMDMLIEANELVRQRMKAKKK